MQKVEAPGGLHPAAIQSFGRTETGADGMYVYQWPGVYFVAAYEGTAIYFRVGEGRQNLHIEVDHHPLPPLITTAPGTYRIATPTGGDHVVRIDSAGENQDGPKTIGAFSLPANSKSLRVPENKRQIEFIGDSHTVGYGNTSQSRDCSQEQVWATTDTTQSFAADVSAHYDADYQINAISGHGVVRNYNGAPGDPVPVAYPFTLFDKQHKYEDRTWNPEVIVVALGTNDFSTPLHSGEVWKTRADLHSAFEQEYVRFVQALRKAHPKALIVLWSTDMADGEIAAEGKKVVETLQHAGDDRVDFVEVSGLAFSGCHWHPSVADDRTMAEKLIRDIDAHKEVWR